MLIFLRFFRQTRTLFIHWWRIKSSVFNGVIEILIVEVLSMAWFNHKTYKNSRGGIR